VGFDPEQVVEIISGSAANSNAFQQRVPMMENRHYLPAQASVNLLHEAVHQTTRFAEGLGSPTPLLSVVARYCDRAVAEGLGEQDTAALFSVLSEEAQSSGVPWS
jgi:3-hydroxyisobutyrate dehydrogenase